MEGPVGAIELGATVRVADGVLVGELDGIKVGTVVLGASDGVKVGELEGSDGAIELGTAVGVADGL